VRLRLRCRRATSGAPALRRAPQEALVDLSAQPEAAPHSIVASRLATTRANAFRLRTNAPEHHAPSVKCGIPAVHQRTRMSLFELNRERKWGARTAVAD